MSVALDGDQIRMLLYDLSAELAARGARADLFVVDGAAIAVAYDNARATRDLDAVFLPTEVVRQAALAVAERRGLSKDWLDDAVKGFLPGPDPDAQRYYASDALTVDVASARYPLPADRVEGALVNGDVQKRSSVKPGTLSGKTAKAGQLPMSPMPSWEYGATCRDPVDSSRGTEARWHAATRTVPRRSSSRLCDRPPPWRPNAVRTPATR
jgi:hypothetical protein